MSSEVIVDTKMIKALSASKRLDILRLLFKKQMTLSEISSALECSNSTISEHLSELVKAGLIKKEDTKRQWKFYELSEKGRRILLPYTSSVKFMLFNWFATFICLSVLLFQLFSSGFFFSSPIQKDFLGQGGQLRVASVMHEDATLKESDTINTMNSIYEEDVIVNESLKVIEINNSVSEDKFTFNRIWNYIYKNRLFYLFLILLIISLFSVFYFKYKKIKLKQSLV
jgi:DNA-binding transcriptional ArsR family regulator